MMRVVIVDDEPIARRGIRQLLASHADVEVVGEARNGAEAVRLLNTLSPDLVFLDVQMPELDGFAVLRQLDPSRLPAVIFVTAYDTFAVRAFESHALDYLVKPVHEQRFHDALARARERRRSVEAIDLARRLAALLAGVGSSSSSSSSSGEAVTRTAVDAVTSSDSGESRRGRLAPRVSEPPRRLVVGTSASDLVLDIAEIAWIEADDYYAAIHARGRRHLVRESLASLEARLDGAQFVRVHRSAIVNLAHVREVCAQPADTGAAAAIVLRDGTQIPLSRRRREQVAEAIRRFAG